MASLIKFWMASFSSTIPVQEHVVSIDNLYEDASKSGIEVAPKEVHIMSFVRIALCLWVQVFVELEELRVATNKGDLEWEETARWIQYEEDVVEETGKWGSPHVSALEYKHIVMVKKLLQKGKMLCVCLCLLVC